jgi:hypothetical protein
MKVRKIKALFLVFLLIISQKVVFGSELDSTKVKVKFKGFIKSDVMYDSRQCATARESFVLMYPKKPLLDKNGLDLNNKPQYNQFATSSRLIISIDTIRYKKSLISANIETDFTGSSELSNSGLRLRHGYLKIESPKQQFIVGQYWHPLVAPEVFPDMLALNLGNPIKSAMRAPQIRYQNNIKSFRLIGVASAYRDNSAIGSLGVIPDYLKNQIIPSLHLQSIYSKGVFLIGAGYDFKRLRMRNFTDSNLVANELVYSSAIHLFAKLDFKKLTIKSQFIWGENLYDQAMLGGLAVTKINPITNDFSYTQISQASAWINIATKFPKFNFSIFSGYALNLGAKNIVVGPVYSRGNDLLYVYRIAPQFSYKMGKVILFSESEITGAAYGSPNNYCIVKNTKEVVNFRENIAILFQF